MQFWRLSEHDGARGMAIFQQKNTPIAKTALLTGFQHKSDGRRPSLLLHVSA
jgi:hypothetical protein